MSSHRAISYTQRKNAVGRTFVPPVLIANNVRDRSLIDLLNETNSPIVDSSEDAIIAKTLDGVIVNWNRAAERDYGYSAREVIGKSISLLFPHELRKDLLAILRALKEQPGVSHYESVWMRKDGTPVDVSVSLSPILSPRGRILGACSIARDISKRKRAEEQLQHLATHDSLTDLWNYRSLLEALTAEFRRSDRTGRSFGLLLIDMDRLKKINDSYGHVVGSRALCRLAAILKSTCRSIDAAARYGGDEFAVLLVEATELNVLSVTDRILKKLQQETELPAIGVSIGKALYPQDGSTLEKLLLAADGDLYKDKLRKGLHSHPHDEGANGPERRRSERLISDMSLVVRGESCDEGSNSRKKPSQSQ
jgi:diguanylate cyclase (GGDEF)-like protein/PAS domain S-box-containing protein